jgi:hypothetical protein
MHLFRFKKRTTDPLVRFTEEVMRGPSPLSHGMRELIGAFISRRINAPFAAPHTLPWRSFWGRSWSMESCTIWRLRLVDGVRHPRLVAAWLGFVAQIPGIVCRRQTDNWRI